MTTPTVSLEKVLEALDMPEEWSKSVDRETGTVIVIPGEVISAVEDDDTEGMDYDETDLEEAKAVLDNPDRYVQLPERFDIHEWDIMRRFADSRNSQAQQSDLLNAIHGSGAFRFFKSTLRRLGIEKDWYEFRDAAILEIAKRWLEDNGLAYK